MVLQVTGADPCLVQYKDSEILTTRQKLVNVSKAVRDLGHRDTYSLVDGMRLTAEWMRQVCQFRPDTMTYADQASVEVLRP